MRINLINNLTSPPSPTFKSWEREIISPKRGVVNRNNTYFFRETDLFSKLTKMLSEKFKDVSKVNVYCYGCSDGSEPFTFIMGMLSVEDEANPKKFFSILARDIEPVAIEKAMNNDYKISTYEKKAIDTYTNGMYNKFIYQPFPDPSDNDELFQIFVKKYLYNYVDFKVGDILTDYKEIQPKNSVVLARNFWPYIHPQSRSDFLKKIYNHLDTGSFFVIGDFDQKGVGYALQGDFELEITRLGFKQTPIRYVFVK